MKITVTNIINISKALHRICRRTRFNKAFKKLRLYDNYYISQHILVDRNMPLSDKDIGLLTYLGVKKIIKNGAGEIDRFYFIDKDNRVLYESNNGV